MTDIADLSVETIVGDPRRPPHRFISTIRNLGPDTARHPVLTFVMVSGSYTVESVTADAPYTMVIGGPTLPHTFSGLGIFAIEWQGSALAAGRSITVETLVTLAASPQSIRFALDISADSSDPDATNNQHDETWTFPIACRGTLPRYGVPAGWGSPSRSLGVNGGDEE